MVNIDGSTVVVTGGQRGLGRAIVDELLARGAVKVYATARAAQAQPGPASGQRATGCHRP